MNAFELSAALGVSRRQVDRWRHEGLPCTGRGKHRTYDRADVEAWLAERAGADSAGADDSAVAGSLAAVARHFGVNERTVAVWRHEGMPGEPGSYRLDEIEAWRRQRGGGERGTAYYQGQLMLVRTQRELFALQREQGKYAELAIVVRVVQRVVNLVLLALEDLPDRLQALLPPTADVGTSRALRELAHETIAAAKQTMSRACDELAAELEKKQCLRK